jgi:hypothetical protein
MRFLFFIFRIVKSQDNHTAYNTASTPTATNAALTAPVLRIRDVYPGSDFFSPGSELFPSRIRIKEFKYFNPKQRFLSSRKYDPGCSFRTQILTFYPSRIPDPGSRGQKGTGSRIRNRNIGLHSLSHSNYGIAVRTASAYVTT